MRVVKLIILTFCLSKISHTQTIYESPLGFTLSFDKTWKQIPKDVLHQRKKEVNDFLEYKKDIQFDACYQKIGNVDMDYPYILFKNICATTNNEDEIKEVHEYFINKSQFDKEIENLVNGKFVAEIKIGENYYDSQNKILIFTFDMGISIKGNLVGMFAFYFGKNASLITYCYSYKDEFKYDQKEFLDIIYSIKDKGMVNTMSNYVSNHDLAVKYYNDGIMQSESGNREDAIVLYTKAIENYPVEDKYMKSEAYFNRALNKRFLNNFRGAIADYTEAIKLRPDYYKAYNNRGFAKMQIEDYSDAIVDFTQTIKYDNYNTEYTKMAFGNRGLAKLSIGLDGCPDLIKAIELGNINLKSAFKELCN